MVLNRPDEISFLEWGAIGIMIVLVFRVLSALRCMKVIPKGQVM
jgi:hypothetical protein